MYPSTISSGLMATLSLSGLALGHPTRDVSCDPIHLLVARGSNEKAGPGQLLSLANDIIAANPGATYESIDYPAILNPYGPSVKQGTVAVKQQLTDYVKSCPDSKIVLLGYSQGAQITGDALCGGDAAGTGPVTPPIDAAIASHVTAIVWYGDPRHNVSASYDQGTATTDGLYVRPASQSCDAFSDLIASYCDLGDPYCSVGNNVWVHLTYPSRHDWPAAAFVNAKLAG
ncbi:cutinase [Akanthomyces lecanii RCEF 1005]|uniref:Cutinase n=1 Tax=Akanthomyces lecanii RCEF 1005 TaxID=1081108 RepID=A0A167YIG8_CORDF|nr:cutinase [Akanthomyces lecanii RCEF 1005]